MISLPFRRMNNRPLDEQVKTLAENCGTTYSSSDLVFGGGS